MKPPFPTHMSAQVRSRKARRPLARLAQCCRELNSAYRSIAIDRGSLLSSLLLVTEGSMPAHMDRKHHQFVERRLSRRRVTGSDERYELSRFSREPTTIRANAAA